MSKPTLAVLDSCVLYSATLRNLFMWLTIRLAFQPKWTEQIHAEWMENLLKNRPDLTSARLERTRELMDRWGRDWSVPEYEPLVDTLVLPDPDDRHVLAAAIASKASEIITFNLSDFPSSVLEPLGIRAVHPDKFLCELFDKDSPLFMAAIHDQLGALRNPPHTLDDLLDRFRLENITNLSDRLEACREEF